MPDIVNFKDKLEMLNNIIWFFDDVKWRSVEADTFKRIDTSYKLLLKAYNICSPIIDKGVFENV